ncbi:S8 family serine peptidase (plasmid) [Streptomyces sp. AHU1]|uniref:S8 family serine peptidase n=1 Tax=Streptomyces sp. AHU1 TaxID=3377215 RepID=UPI003878116E
MTTEPAATSLGRLDRTNEDTVRDRRRQIGTRQTTFLRQAENAGVHPHAVRRLSLLTDTVALTVPSSEVSRLSNLPGVASVVPDAFFHTSTDVSVPLIGAPEVWKSSAPEGKTARGAGVTIAILDTGVDYTHPDLGDGIGPGHKVVAGYDFVNDDSDPMDDNGHGTHVAGIAAARTTRPGGITGVAPDATLTAYKVANSSGSAFASDIIAGLEAATDPTNPFRADVVNMSLGSDGDGTDPVGEAASAAVRAGVVVVAAAGNTGPNAGTVSTPGNADGVISVGASTSNLRIPSLFTTSGKPQLVQASRGVVSANPPAHPVTAEVVDIGAGTLEEWKKAGDVRGKIVLTSNYVPVQLNELTGDHMMLDREAEKRGALALVGGPPDASAGPQSVPAVPAVPGVIPAQPSTGRVQESGDSLRMDTLVTLSTDDLQYRDLHDQVTKGTLRLTLRSVDATDELASFSSRGPSPSFDLKPDLVAPGVEIRSTVPSALWAPGQYRMSGTSMASPHVAGAAALLRQLRPDLAPEQIKSELVGTALHLKGLPATAQGAGRIDVAAAAHAQVTAAPASVSFRLADLSSSTLNASASVTVTNTGSRTVKASVTTTGQAKATPARVRVKPHATSRITVTMNASRPKTDADLDGLVSIKPDHGSPLNVPYLLAVRHLDTEASPDPSNGYTNVYIHSPTPLKAPPAVTVTSRQGVTRTYTAALDHDQWYNLAVTVRDAGTYQVETRAVAATGQVLMGSDAFEVTQPSSSAGSWQAIGPNSEAGEVTEVPGAPGEAVLAQYQKAALWFTKDNGRSWTQRGRLPVASTDGRGKVVIDAHNPKRWWYTVDNSTLNRTWVLRTDDSGLTWTVLNTIPGLLTAFLSDDQTHTLVLVSGTQVLTSTDGGITWRTVPTGTGDYTSSAAIVDDSLYLSTFDTVWVRSGVNTGALGPARRLFSDASASIHRIVADKDVIALHDSNLGVRVSYDKGATWSTALDLPVTGNNLIDERGTLFLGAGSDNIAHLSRDHGRTWSDFPLPTDRAVVADYDAWPDGTITVSSEGDGLYRSATDGTGSHRIGVQGTTVNDLAVSDGNLLAATAYGVFKTKIPALDSEWGRSGGEGHTGVGVPKVAISASRPTTVWRVTTLADGTFTVDRSEDAGRTWQVRGQYAQKPLALTVDATDPDRVYVAFVNIDHVGLYTTDNGGASWHTRYHKTSFTVLAADPGKPGQLWLGNENGLYHSDDAGVTVSKVADGPVYSITSDGSRLLLGGDGIRVSADHGRTFRTADTGGLPAHIFDVVRAGRALYAASGPYSTSGLIKNGRGVLRSDDNGLTWRNVSAGLQCSDVVSLAAAPDGTALYAGTVNGGVHRLALLP